MGPLHSPVLLLIILLLQGFTLIGPCAATQARPRNPCYDNEFWCRDGTCAPLVKNCSGDTACRDLSDTRSASCHPHYTFLDVDDKDTLAIPLYDERWEGVIVMYCDKKKEKCIALDVQGETPEASVKCDGWSECSFFSWDFNCTTKTSSQAPRGWEPYKDQQSIKYYTFREGNVIVFRSVLNDQQGRTVIIDGSAFSGELVLVVLRPKKWLSMTNAIFI